VDVAPAEALTFSGCSMYRRHGHLGEMTDAL
jgi:hypothetical protein